MSNIAADTKFRRGLAALRERRYQEAAASFKAALEIEKHNESGPRNWRYLSYYGLSLLRLHGPNPDVLELCLTAARNDPYDPEVLLNLSRGYAISGKKTRALRVLEKGVENSPGSRALRAELTALDRRSRPVVPFLHRDNALNRLLGKLRHGLRTRWIARQEGGTKRRRFGLRRA